MNRHLWIAALVVLTTGVAGAQPAPGPTPTPAPAPAPTPAPAPEPPRDQPPPTEPAPPPEEAKPAAEEKPAVTAKYDGGVKFSTDDGAYEMKLSFRNQMRFEANRALE